MKGVPGYTNVGHAAVKEAHEVEISGKWVSLDQFGAGLEISWGNHRVDTSSMQEKPKMRLKFECEFDLAPYSAAYSVEKVADDTEFVLRIWNAATRRKSVVYGSVTKTVVGSPKRTVLKCSASVSELDLKEFRGDIEIQPLLTAQKSMFDRRFSVNIAKGAILGWTDPTTIIIDRSRKGIASLFDFRWISFSGNDVPGLSSSEFFALRWENPPIIYLNSDIENLQMVLTAESKTGRAARLRESLSSFIAQQALTLALSTSIYSARDAHLESPDLGAEEILDVLPDVEKRVIQAWIKVADENYQDGVKAYVQSLEHFLSMEDSEVQRLLIEALPTKLQGELASGSSTEFLLKEFVSQGRINE